MLVFLIILGGSLKKYPDICTKSYCRTAPHGTNHLIPKLKTTFVFKSSVKLNNAVDPVSPPQNQNYCSCTKIFIEPL